MEKMNWLLPVAGVIAAYFFLVKKQAAPAMPAGSEQFKNILKVSTTTLRPERQVADHIKKAFVAAMLRYAPEIERLYGIKPVVWISQAALESSFGTSGLAQQGKNLFGIKVSRAWEAAGKPIWTGQTEEFVGGRYILIKERFKKYSTWKESIYDYAELISKVYKTAYGYAVRGDVAGFGRAIVATGYSTHPQYASLLVDASRFVA